jgi:hypothetical protein
MRKKADVASSVSGRQNQPMAHRHHRVACVLSDGMTSIGVAIANDIFGAPWELELGVPWYRYRVCTADASPVRVGVLRVEVEAGVSALSLADTVVIPGRGVRPPAAELLDGRPATTLWSHAERFRERFPWSSWIPVSCTSMTARC